MVLDVKTSHGRAREEEDAVQAGAMPGPTGSCTGANRNGVRKVSA